MKISQYRLPKDTVARTLLYLDQRVSSLELDLWHTAVFQRLYYIRQLGFSDRIFPDAVHNRFNHVLGVCQRAEDILVAAARQTKPTNVSGLAASIEATDDHPEVLRGHIESRIDTARLMALLHDLSHIPFGHTLEDELHLFSTKHDAHTRQTKMFNRITSQFIWGLYDDVVGCWPERWSSEVKPEQVIRLAKELLDASRGEDSPRQLAGFDHFLVNLLAAQLALVTMHHGYTQGTKGLFLPTLLERLQIEAEAFDPKSDYFLIDAIGNTICADLLDYARRDMRMANMVGDYDDRLFRWFVLAQVPSENPKETARVRLAIKVFSNKLKPDILREILRVLEIRYDLSERILFHPAKCCAGAMLGRVVEALGLADSLEEMLSMGDEAFLNWVEVQIDGALKLLKALRDGADESQLIERRSSLNRAVLEGLAKRLGVTGVHDFEPWRRAEPVRLERAISELDAALSLSDRLRSRHYYQLVYEVTAENDDSSGRTISSKYKQRSSREELVRVIEERCSLPPGTVLIHCPRRETNLKAAEVFVLYAPDAPPEPLCNAAHVPQLKRIAERAKQLSDEYKTIWRLRVFLHKGFRHLAASVARFLADELAAANSPYLETAQRMDRSYSLVVDFLKRHGGDDGRRMVAEARNEMAAARKGTGSRRPSFEECLKRQEKKREDQARR